MLKEQKIYRIQGDSDEVFLQYNLIKKFTFSVVKTIGRKKMNSIDYHCRAY